MRMTMREVECRPLRRATLFIVCAAVAACATSPRAAPVADVEADVRAARARWNTALVARDSSVLEVKSNDVARRGRR